MEKVSMCCLLFVCSIILAQGERTLVFQELLPSVRSLMEMVKQNATRLHSPPIDTNDCLLSTFKCFVNQSALLVPADGPRAKDFNTSLDRINISPKLVKLTNTNLKCPPCGSYKTESEQDFLGSFEILLQRLNRMSWIKCVLHKNCQ